MPTEDPLVPRGCTSLKLRQLTRRVSQHYDHVVSECGLKTTQYSLLSQIERLGAVRPSDLAAAMAMDPSTLTRNLQPLIEHGWVRVGPGADGRSRLVVLTARGSAKRAEAQRAWKRAQLALNDRLGSDRVAALHALLDGCLATLSEPETSDA
ncbi:MAG TPA: MarR family winged helix-turn-helix transcriptional regulator [Caldimonas sp.]|jgi:DNA-binding MarR family transcriptional regulator|nr:MarR family winged helix-turn-helix transcriptional regulator [Caldimonas sp.]HEX4234744.1 MarR family winged helix-turn-helix transcriptional regulator [Caldimonas sp.]